MPSEVKLSVRQELFILFILKGEAQSRAYRLAGYKASNENVAMASSSALLSNPKVNTRLAELRQAIQIRHVVTLETLTEDLFRIRRGAEGDGKWAAAASAVGLLAKMHGLLIDRSEVSVTHRPAPLPTKLLELSEEEWREQFVLKSPAKTGVVKSPTDIDKRQREK